MKRKVLFPIVSIFLFSLHSVVFASDFNDEFTIRYISVVDDPAYFYLALTGNAASLDGCPCDSGGCYVGMELSSAASKETYSLALSAMHSGKLIRVLGNSDDKTPYVSGGYGLSVCKIKQAIVMQ